MKPSKSRLKQVCKTRSMLVVRLSSLFQINGNQKIVHCAPLRWNVRLSAVYKVGLRGEAEEFLTLYKARTNVLSRSAQYTIASFFMYCRMQNHYCVRVNQLNQTVLKFLVLTSTNCLEREWIFLWGAFSKHILSETSVLCFTKDECRIINAQIVTIRSKIITVNSIV